MADTRMVVNGIGTYNRGIGPVLRHARLLANMSLTLIDGRTSEQISRPFQNLGANLVASLRLTQDPLTLLDNSLFPDPPAAASSSAALRERTRELVTERLDRGLPGYPKSE